MVAPANSIHARTLAIYYEVTPGLPPGFVTVTLPGGSAAAWAALEGGNVDRLHHFEALPAPLKQSTIADPRVTDRVRKRFQMIKGLRNADGLSLVIGLHGSGSVTADTMTVTETGLMRLLEHCMGGLHLGNSTTVDVTVGDDFDYDVVSDTNLIHGAMVAIEDTDATGRLHPQRILTRDGAGAITTDQDLPFTLVAADIVNAVAVAYVDPDALVNPSDANASFVSVLIEEAGRAWEGVGGALQLDSIEFPRNDVPRFNITGMFSNVFPPSDGSPGLVTWTGVITGEAGIATGADSKLHIQDKGTTTTQCFDVVGTVTVNPGINRIRIEVDTECDENLQGTAGYTTDPGETTIEVPVILDPVEWQDGFDTDQRYNVKWYQVAPAGSGWVVQMPDGELQEAPEFGEANEIGIHNLKFVGHEDESMDALSPANPELARSNIVVGFF